MLIYLYFVLVLLYCCNLFIVILIATSALKEIKYFLFVSLFYFGLGASLTGVLHLESVVVE